MSIKNCISSSPRKIPRYATGLPYQNVLEPLNITHRILISIVMKNDFIDQNYYTADLFKKLKLLTLKEIYNKASTIFTNKKDFKTHNVYSTRYEDNGNLLKLNNLFKPNTTLMQNYYTTILYSK